MRGRLAVAAPPWRVGNGGVTVALPPGWHSTTRAGGSAQWAERGHSFAAYVLLGRNARPHLAARAPSVPDTLRVGPR
jgi:hypothetical protein